MHCLFVFLSHAVTLNLNTNWTGASISCVYFSFWIRVSRTSQTEQGEVAALTWQKTRGFLVFVPGPKTLLAAFTVLFSFISQLFFHPCHQVCQTRAQPNPPPFQLGHLQLISHFLVDFSPLSLSISSLIPFGLRRISNRGCFSATLPRLSFSPPPPTPDCKSSGFSYHSPLTAPCFAHTDFTFLQPHSPQAQIVVRQRNNTSDLCGTNSRRSHLNFKHPQVDFPAPKIPHLPPPPFSFLPELTSQIARTAASLTYYAKNPSLSSLGSLIAGAQSSSVPP